MIEAHELDLLEVQVMVAPEAGLTVAFLGFPGEHHTWLAKGKSICHPDDPFDFEIGEYLAIGRALESLGHKYVKRAEGLTKHQEDIEAHRAQITPRKDIWPVAKEAFYRFVQSKHQ